MLGPLLRRYHADRPDVVVEPLEDGPDGVLEHVRARRAELGLLHLPPPGTAAAANPDLDVAVVRREPLVAVLPRAEAGRVGDLVDLAVLAGHTFLAPPRASWGGLQPHLRGACRLAGVEPVVREVALVQTVVTLVGAGLGVSVLPASVRAVAGDDVVLRPLARPAPVVETAVVRRRADAPSPQAQHFLRHALATPEPDVLGPDHARQGRGPT